MRLSTRVAVVAAAAILAGAGALWITRPAAPDDPGLLTPAVVVPTSAEPSASTSASAPASPRPASTIGVRDAAPTPSVEAAPPVGLSIPALGAELPVEPMGLDAEGAMALPESPSEAGWYRFGPAPGSGSGATVIAAHVDAPREGRGPMAGLVRLQPGDVVEVRTTVGVHRYEVTEVLRIDKGELDPDAVFSREGRERLHVVSCGGRFDRAARHYEDNVIAVAVPVDAP